MVMDAPPALEVYYASYCAPCRLELPVLARAAEGGAAVTVIILSEEKQARRELAAASPLLAETAVARVQGDPRPVLAAAGDERALLPYSRVLGADGRICGRWHGRLTVQRIAALLKSCKG